MYFYFFKKMLKNTRKTVDVFLYAWYIIWAVD